MRRALLPALAATMALSACGTPRDRGVESIHQPVVTRANYTLDLIESGTALAPGEDRRLAAWFDALRVGYGDRVSVDDPSPNRATREAIAMIAARYGLLLGNGAPTLEGPIAPSSVRVVLTRAFASVQGCPDWSRPRGPEFDSSNTSNYGCAGNTNLAAMVANPNDLVAGEADARTNEVVAARSVKSYRSATPLGAGGTTVQSVSSKGN